MTLVYDNTTINVGTIRYLGAFPNLRQKEGLGFELMLTLTILHGIQLYVGRPWFPGYNKVSGVMQDLCLNRSLRGLGL